MFLVFQGCKMSFVQNAYSNPATWQDYKIILQLCTLIHLSSISEAFIIKEVFLLDLRYTG